MKLKKKNNLTKILRNVILERGKWDQDCKTTYNLIMNLVVNNYEAKNKLALSVCLHLITKAKNRFRKS